MTATHRIFGKTPKTSKRALRTTLSAIAAAPVLAGLMAFPSAASADVCGPSKQTYHSSSWAFKQSWFTDKGCIAASGSRVWATGSFRVAGTVGANSYTAHTVIKDMTTGRAITLNKTSSWGEGGVNWNNIICAVVSYSFCPSNDTVIYTTGSVARTPGHNYAVWVWHDVDVMNDGKGTFSDPQSYASWTAPKS